MTKRYNVLTWALFNAYGGRKKQGLLSFLYDSNENCFIPVPRNMEHVDFVSKLLNLEKEELQIHAKHIIPVNIVVEYDVIVAMVIGVSGMEIGFNVRHSKKDLKNAEKAAVNFVISGELPVAENFDVRLIKRY